MCQKLRGFTHALVRLNHNLGAVMPEEQKNGAYSGFYASILDPISRSKAYFHLTLPKPPNKSVVNDVMKRCVRAAEEKKMPFIQLTGDQPVYALTKEVKSENPEEFKIVLPILGGFHSDGLPSHNICKIQWIRLGSTGCSIWDNFSGLS